MSTNRSKPKNHIKDWGPPTYFGLAAIIVGIGILVYAYFYEEPQSPIDSLRENTAAHYKGKVDIGIGITDIDGRLVGTTFKIFDGRCTYSSSVFEDQGDGWKIDAGSEAIVDGPNSCPLKPTSDDRDQLVKHD